jgi:VWFA-related protein
MNRILSLAAMMLMAAAPQQKTFKADVELVAVEATVIDNKNAPVTGLGPNDFDVTISGKTRHVVKAEWLTYGSESTVAVTAGAPAAAAPAAAPGATPASTPPARKYIVAIDEGSFQPAAVLAAKAAAERFIDKLRADDYVGVYAYPTGKANMALSQDHAAVKKVLAGVNAVRHEPISQFHLAVGEIVDIANGDAKALARVVHRECGEPEDETPPQGCVQANPRQVLTEATGLASYLEMEVTRSVEGLRGLVRGLARVPGRKILVLVSGGLYSSDRVVGRRVSSGSTIHTLTHDAAAANLELYVLHLDWSFLESFAEQNITASGYYRNSDIAETGLDILASDLGGDVTRVRGTNPDFAFNQVLTKTSAYYLLGVEPADEDRDGKPHPIKVKAKRRGVEVLSHTEVTIPAK